MDLCGILCFHRFTRHHKAEDCEGCDFTYITGSEPAGGAPRVTFKKVILYKVSGKYCNN